MRLSLPHRPVDPERRSRGRRIGGDGASPVPDANLDELLRSLSEFAALLPALILLMLLISPYQQDRLLPFFEDSVKTLCSWVVS